MKKCIIFTCDDNEKKKRKRSDLSQTSSSSSHQCRFFVFRIELLFIFSIKNNLYVFIKFATPTNTFFYHFRFKITLYRLTTTLSCGCGISTRWKKYFLVNETRFEDEILFIHHASEHYGNPRDMAKNILSSRALTLVVLMLMSINLFTNRLLWILITTEFLHFFCDSLINRWFIMITLCFSYSLVRSAIFFSSFCTPKVLII